MLVGDLQRSGMKRSRLESPGWDSLREFSILQWLKTTDSIRPKKDGFQPILRNLTLNPQSRQIFPINSQTRWFKPWPFYPRFFGKGKGGRSERRFQISKQRQRKEKRNKSPNQAAWIKQLSLNCLILKGSWSPSLSINPLSPLLFPDRFYLGQTFIYGKCPIIPKPALRAFFGVDIRIPHHHLGWPVTMILGIHDKLKHAVAGQMNTLGGEDFILGRGLSPKNLNLERKPFCRGVEGSLLWWLLRAEIPICKCQSHQLDTW